MGGSSSCPRKLFRAVVKKVAMGGRLWRPVPHGAQRHRVPARGRHLQGQRDRLPQGRCGSGAD